VQTVVAFDDGQETSRNFPTKMVESLLESIAVKNNGVTQFKAWTYLAYHRRAEKRDPGSTPRALQRKWFSAPAGMYLSEPMFAREGASLGSLVWEWLSGSVAVPRRLNFEWGDEQRMAIVWSLPATEVMLAGEFTSPPWSVRLRLLRCPKSEKFWMPVKAAFPTLPPGKYDYKFIVDGQWRIDPAGYTHRDTSGHINNVLHHEVALDDKGHSRVSHGPHKKAWSAGDHEEEAPGAPLKSANSFGPSTIEFGRGASWTICQPREAARGVQDRRRGLEPPAIFALFAGLSQFRTPTKCTTELTHVFTATPLALLVLLTGSENGNGVSKLTRALLPMK